MESKEYVEKAAVSNPFAHYMVELEKRIAKLEKKPKAKSK